MAWKHGLRPFQLKDIKILKEILVYNASDSQFFGIAPLIHIKVVNTEKGPSSHWGIYVVAEQHATSIYALPDNGIQREVSHRELI